MEQKRIAEPDYDFKLDTVCGARLADKVFFSSEVAIMKCISGRALVSINSEKHEFPINSNFLLVEGMMFKVVESSEDFEVILLRFSSNFFNVVYPLLDGKAIEVMEHSAPDLYKEEDMEIMDLIFRQLCVLYYKKEHAYRNKMTLNLVVNYIFEVYEQTYKYVRERVPLQVSDNRTFLLDRFFTLCNEVHVRHRNIEYYAEKLSITSRYLHKICKDTLQITPKQCIDYMVSGSAKRYLLISNLNNQQIAHELNFPDQATFGQFFKRNVGISPSEFRSKYK